MKNWWRRWQDKRVPKIQLGGKVKIMHGETLVGVMVLTEFSSVYNGGMEARMIDVGTYLRKNRCS